MRIHQVKDERIVALNRKIQSEAYAFLTVLLGISVFIKGYVLDMPPAYFITEILAIVLAALYTVIRGAMVGHSTTDASPRGWKWRIAGAVGLSLAVSAVSGIRNYSLYGAHYTGVLDGHFLAVLGITFLSSLIFFALVFAFVAAVDVAGQKRLEKKLSDEDDAE